jgi:hypothetical protein
MKCSKCGKEYTDTPTGKKWLEKHVLADTCKAVPPTKEEPLLPEPPKVEVKVEKVPPLTERQKFHRILRFLN